MTNNKKNKERDFLFYSPSGFEFEEKMGKLEVLDNSRIMKIAFFLFILKRKIKLLFVDNKKLRYIDSENVHILNDGRPKQKTNIAVHVHVYFTYLIPEICDYLNNINFKYTCFVTTDTKLKEEMLSLFFKRYLKEKDFKVIVCENKGRDIGPWVNEMKRYNDQFDLWCHIHSKVSLHIPYTGSVWRKYLLDNILGSTCVVESILSVFENDPNLGLVFPPFFSGVYNKENQSWVLSEKDVKQFFRDSNLGDPPSKPIFPAGAMLWYRSAALKDLFTEDIPYDSFGDDNFSHGTLAHLLERSLVYYAAKNGYSYKEFISQEEQNKVLQNIPFP